MKLHACDYGNVKIVKNKIKKEPKKNNKPKKPRKRKATKKVNTKKT